METKKQEPKQISIKLVIEMLESGQDRDKIADFFKLTTKEKMELFSHPKLKGRKIKKLVVSNLQIVDDATDVEPVPERKKTPHKPRKAKQPTPTETQSETSASATESGWEQPTEDETKAAPTTTVEKGTGAFS